jgi:hypothetical protein
MSSNQAAIVGFHPLFLAQSHSLRLVASWMPPARLVE